MQLDYTIETQQQRADAIASACISAGKIPHKECETMANYILWGADATHQRSPQDCARQSGYELPSKHGHWDRRAGHKTSLDSMIEAGASPVDPTVPLGTIRQRFDRDLARKQAPPHILTSLEAIWKQCDQLEVVIDSYALYHGLRSKPIRDEMHQRLTPAEFAQCEEQAKHITQQQYLAMRHQLIDLRTEQYSLRDSYAAYRQRRTTVSPLRETAMEIPILPVSMPDGIVLGHWPEPGDSIQYFEGEPGDVERLHFDFREPEHLAKLFDIYNDIKAEITVEHVSLEECESILPRLFSMLQYYISIADLSPMHMDILTMKTNHVPNRTIAQTLHERYGKNYGENYISTIYHKKILQQIAETVELHYATLKKINDPAAFKTCIDCGRTLLKDPANFMRKKRVLDGYAPRCKKCAAEKRKGVTK